MRAKNHSLTTCFSRLIPILLVCMSGLLAHAQPVIIKPAEERSEQLQQRLEGTNDERMRYMLLVQILYEYENQGNLEELLNIYQALLETPQMKAMGTQAQHLRQVGNYLQSRGQYRQALQLYNQFLETFPAGSGPETLRTQIEAAKLSALYSSGDYQAARSIALETLDATGEPVPIPVLTVLVELAESDILKLSEQKQLEDALFDSPMLRSLLPRLTRLYMNQGRSNQSVDLLDRLLEQKHKDFLALLDVVENVYKTHFQGEAKQRLLDKLDNLTSGDSEKSIEYDLIRARWLSRMGSLDDALALLESHASQSVEVLNELATLYYNAARYDKAITAFERLVQKQPRQINHYRMLGEALYRKKRTQEAIQAWKRIPRVLGDSAAAYQTLAEIFQMRGLNQDALDALQQARVRPGARIFDILSQILAIRMDIGDDEALLREYLSASMVQVGYEYNFRQQIVEQASDPERCRKLLTTIEKRMGEYKDAKRLDLLRRLGTDLLMSLGEYSQAIEFVSRSYGKSHGGDRQMYQLGSDLLLKGAIDAAAKAWQRIQPGSAYFSQARAEIAKMCLAYHRDDEARRGAMDLVKSMIDHLRFPPAQAKAETDSSTLEACLRALPRTEARRFAEALQVLAEVDLRQKQPGDALRWLKPLETQPALANQLQTLLMLGHAYSQLGSLDTAEGYYRRVIDSKLPPSPQQKEAKFYLAECLLWKEQISEAMEMYHEMAQHSPQADYTNEALRRYIVLTFAPAEQLHQYTLATLFDWKGNLDEAVRLYREAAADDAESDVAGWCLYEVARMFAERGMKDQAQRQINHILERYDHPTLQAECQVLLANLSEPVPTPESISDATGPYADLLLQHPNSLYSDLARLKLEGRLKRPF